MSWLRSAVSKAVEVGGKNNLTRTVRNYADTVGHAVAEGAKILQDRMVIALSLHHLLHLFPNCIFFIFEFVDCISVDGFEFCDCEL